MLRVILLGILLNIFFLISPAIIHAQTTCEEVFQIDIQEENMENLVNKLCSNPEFKKQCDTDILNFAITQFNNYQFRTIPNTSQTCVELLRDESKKTQYKNAFSLAYINVFNSINTRAPTDVPLGSVPTIGASQQGISIDQTVNDPGEPTPTPGEYTPNGWFVKLEDEPKTYGDTCGLGSSDDPLKQKCCISKMPTVKWNVPNGFNVFTEFATGGVNMLIGAINAVSEVTQVKTHDVAISIGTDGPFSKNPFCYDGWPHTKDGIPHQSGSAAFADLDCTCKVNPELGGKITKNASICEVIKDEDEKKACEGCSGSIEVVEGKEVVKNPGVWTSLGCIKTDFSTFITNTVFGTGIGIAGLIALLCIIYSAFLMQTSQGNPEQITKAQEMLTSCITGLIMIIFSVLILRFIGVDLLRIPGFSNTSEVAKDDSGIITKVSLASPTPIITPGTTAVPVTTLPPSPTITRTPITVLTNIPTPLVTSATTLTPILSPSPSFTPIPTPTPVRNPALGEFDCDTNGPLANEVYLYDDLDHKGYCVRLYVAGFHNLNKINNELVNFWRPWSFAKCDNWNYEDCISSIKVGSGVKVTLYNDRDYSGDSITLISGDYPNLGLRPTSNNNTVIDRISSVLVEVN